MTDDALALLRDHDHFLLTTHIRPDGDAIGSELGLGRYLQRQGKSVTLLNSDPVPDHLAWLPGADQVEVFDGTPDQLKALAEAEVAVVLDTNAAERLGDVAGPLRRSGATTLLVDHHTDPEGWFDHRYQRDTAAATAELLYELIRDDRPELVDADLATALYTGIMTDTGSFRYSSVTPSVHRAVADLLERGGIEPAPVHSALYDNRSLASLRLLSSVLQRIRLRYDGQVGYAVVTPEMLKAADATSDDKQGLVSYVLSIEGVRAALLFTETSGGTKVSFRSAIGTHVNGWAQSFGGGGHRNASGAYLEGYALDEAVEAVVGAAPRFLDLGNDQPGGDTLSDEDAAYLEEMLKTKSK